MEDSELTRKAIQELMQNMDEHREDSSTPVERKKNPLGRPNKLFLGRTINSMLTHNKRQSDRNLQRCERKLRELDERQREHKIRKHFRSKNIKSENVHTGINVDICDNVCNNKSNQILKKVKKKKRRKRSLSTSSSSSLSSTSSNSDTHSSSSRNTSHRKISNRKKKRHKEIMAKEEDDRQEFYDYDNDVGYYLDPNMAYAAMAFSQINHMMQHQQQVFHEEMVKKELIEIPSDLSITSHSSSDSSLNISLNSSSAEEDENGILTFKLSSDDDDTVSRISKAVNIKINTDKTTLIDHEESDVESVCSHISLESIDSQKSTTKNPTEIYLLSSSCSDSEEIEIVESNENINNSSSTL